MRLKTNNRSIKIYNYKVHNVYFHFQEYFGERVEWCFCKGSQYGEPCNAASRDDLAKRGDDYTPYDYDRKSYTSVRKNNVYYSQPQSEEKKHGIYYSQSQPKNNHNVYYSQSEEEKKLEKVPRDQTKHYAYSDFTKFLRDDDKQKKIQRLTAQKGHSSIANQGTIVF